MEKKNNQAKVVNYQTLDTFQTNSPALTSEESIRKIIDSNYADALFGFAVELQKAFALDPVFNQPEKNDLQKTKVTDLFYKHFASFSQIGEEDMEHLLLNLISGNQLAYNFAYGLKLYMLFKKDSYMRIRKKVLFQTRIESNVLSRYYTYNPKKHSIPKIEEKTSFYEPVRQKLSRYRIFCSKENSF